MKNDEMKHSSMLPRNANGRIRSSSRCNRWLAPWAVLDRPRPATWPQGFRPTWIEVDWSSLEWNLGVLKSFLPENCSLAAVVKDNAYGHGMVPVSRFLQPRVEMFAVAILEEGLLLRKAGVKKPVLILNGLWPGQEAAALQADLIPSVSATEALIRLAEECARRGKPGSYHLKLDTGMHRLGLPGGELGDFLGAARRFSPAVRCEGVFSHLACADSDESGPTRRQIDLFRSALAALSDFGLAPRWVHLANSAGVLYWKESHFSLVRPGISLYGYDPKGKNGQGRLRPALSLKSRITMVKEVKAGQAVGYGGTFVADKDLRIAVIPVGYGDGFSRSWSNCGRIFVRDLAAPVVGRVSMDTITADVSAIPGVAAGEEVVLFGGKGSASADAGDLAERLQTIPYEILTALSPRIVRIYGFHPDLASHGPGS